MHTVRYILPLINRTFGGTHVSGPLAGPARQVRRGTCMSGLVAGPTQFARGIRRSVMRPTRGTRVSGRTDAWDPHVRSDQTRVAPAWQFRPDPRGTHVSGRTDAWDPRVRSDRRVGPVC
jgi:hypothetical protein